MDFLAIIEWPEPGPRSPKADTGSRRPEAVGDQVGGHVFVSYSRDDLRYVQRLAQHLTDAGVQAWLDKEIPTGDRWDTVIREKIEAAAAVIVVMSPRSEESAWVANEIHHALAIKKPILPLLLEGRQFFTLMRIHHEDVTGRQMPGQSFMATLSELLDIPDPAPAPRARAGISPRLYRPRVLVVFLSIVAALAIVVAVAQSWGDRPSGGTSPQGRTSETHAEPGIVISTAGSVPETVAFNPDGTVLASGGGNDYTVRLWDPSTGQLIRPLIGDGLATAIAFSPDGKNVVSNGDLALWNTASGENESKLNGGGWCVAFSPDGELLAVGDAFNTVRLLVPRKGKLLRTLTMSDEPENVVESVAFRRDGEVVAAGSYDGTVALWNPRSGARIGTFTNDGGAYWMAFAPDGTLYVASGSGPVTTWNTATGTQTGTLAEATTAALSHDGKLLATADKRDYSVRLWDTTTGELKDIFVGHANSVEALAFSDDGRVLATGGADQTIRLWNVVTL